MHQCITKAFNTITLYKPNRYKDKIWINEERGLGPILMNRFNDVNEIGHMMNAKFIWFI